MMFFNTLLNSPEDELLRKELHKELKSLNILEKIKGSQDPSLQVQMSVFKEELATEANENVDVKNPTEVVKILQQQLSQACQLKFTAILNYFMSVVGENPDERSQIKSWTTLEAIIREAVRDGVVANRNYFTFSRD